MLDYAGDVVFERGQGYVQYVHGLRVEGSHAYATIQARRVYAVELDWSRRDLTSHCTCPHFDKGAFCKHLVALGLAVMESNGPRQAPGLRAVDHVDTYLHGLDASALRELVRELAARDPAVDQLLDTRAAVATGDPDLIGTSLVEKVNDVLSSWGFVDYRRSFDVAREAGDLLDELAEHLDGGAAAAVEPALRRAVTRLRKLTENADDSGGMLGEACQQAADLHARACRNGRPDPVKLARWLVRFRAESQGWPELPLSGYASALGDRGLAAYRKAVAALDHKHASGDEYARSRVDTMLLELADHDRDVDRAIEILTAGKHQKYGAVITRLRAARRDNEVVAWMDQAVALNRLGTQGGGYWLDPADVAETYLAAGRVDDAFAVLRKTVADHPGLPSLALLLRFAEPLGRAESERAWALSTLEEQAAGRFGTGAVLVEIALAEKDLDTAWAAAEQFGAGYRWQELAKASRTKRPRAAADLYRPGIEDRLKHPNSKLYPGIAGDLATMRDLYRKAGDTADFEEYVAGIRTTYGNRPALMAALAKRRL